MIVSVLNQLAEEKLEFWLQGESLKYRGNAEALTPDILDFLKSNKEAIIEHIQSGEYASNSSDLSVGQKALWFIQKSYPECTAYNVGQAYSLPERTNIAILRESIEILSARHPILRTRFFMKEGKIIQQVQGYLPPSFTVYQAHDLSDEDLRVKLEEVYNKPFSLDGEPLVRTALFVRKGRKPVLMFNIHHIICDGFSFFILIRDLQKIYSSITNERPLPNLETSLQYTDFVQWEKEYLDSDSAKKALSYWSEKLSGWTSPLNITTDYPRPVTQTFNGNAATLDLGKDLSEKIHNFSKTHNVTPFVFLLSAYHILLNRYSGQERILVGSPTMGRSDDCFYSVAGYFVNPVVLEANFCKDLSFLDLLHQVSQDVHQSLAAQSLPFSYIVDKLGIPRDPGRSPLFQVMFSLQKKFNNQEDLDFLLGEEDQKVYRRDLPTENFDFTQEAGQFELTLELQDTGDSFFGEFKYNSDLFAESTIQRMCEQFKVLIESILGSPESTVSGLNILPQAEYDVLIKDWNDTHRNYDNSRLLYQLFEDQARDYPGQTALVFEGDTISYGEFNRQVNKLAHFLIKEGVQKNQLIGVCLERSFEMVTALFAIQKAGGAYVPIDPDYPQSRLQYMLDDSKVEIVLTMEKHKSKVPETARLLSLDSQYELWENLPDGNPNLPIGGDDPAYMIYTSGSTGKPKGVINCHKGILNRLQWMQETFQLSHEDCVMQKTPFSFDVSVWEFFWPLMAGATIVIAKPEGHKDSSYLVDLVKARQVTTMHFVPSMLSVFLYEKNLDQLSSLKRVICSGEALGIDHENRFFLNLPQAELHNLYGPTEAAVDVTWWPCHREEAKHFVPIGRAIANTQIYILDKNLKPQPIGVPGELYIGGIQVAQGYWNKEDLTKERFLPDPFNSSSDARIYKTGDLARFLDDGNVEYLGRIDFQVKIRGFRIELDEISYVLSGFDQVKECVVTVHEPKGGGKQIAAYIVPSEDIPFDKDNIREHMKSLLPEYMVPSFFTIIEEIPLSPNGKVDRRALPEPDRGSSDRDDYSLPQTDCEKALAAVWSEALSVEKVYREHNFFSLGGDSIRALETIALAKEKGIYFTVQDLFIHQDLKGLSGHIEEQQHVVKDEVYRTFSLLSDEDKEKLPPEVIDAYPMSTLQSGMVFHSEVDPYSPVYHDVFSYRVSFTFDENHFVKTLKQVIASNEILRTSFDLTGFSVPMQIVHKENSRLPYEFLDLSNLEPIAQESVLLKWVEEEKKRIFRWEEAPLIHFFLHRLKEDEFLFTLSFHHSILDGWSVATLLTEFMAQYKGVAKKEVKAPYASFIKEELKTLAQKSQQEFWYNKAGSLSVSSIPRYPKFYNKNQGTSFRTNTVFFNKTEADHLRVLAAGHDIDVKGILLAAHLWILSIWNNSSQVSTGLVFNSRPEAEGSHRSLGLFLNTLPMEIKIDRKGSFWDLVNLAREGEGDIIPYRSFPVSEVQKIFGRERLLETTFLYVNFHVVQGLLDYDDFKILDLNIFEQTDIPYVVHCVDNPLSGVIEVKLNFNDGDLSEEMIQGIAKAFKNILNLKEEEYTLPLEDLSLLAQEEKALQLQQWNPVLDESCSEDTVLSLIEETVKLNPVKKAVIFKEESWTYQDLWERSGKIANNLKKLNLPLESSVGVYLNRSLEMVATLIAILRADCAYIPLDPMFPENRIAMMLEDSSCPVVISQESIAADLPDFTGEVLILEELENLQSETSLKSHLRSENLMYTIFTSGSTGRPKGVQIEHKAVVNFLKSMSKTPGITSEDVLLSVTTISFDISILEIFLPLITGATLAIADKATSMDGEALMAEIERTEATIMQATPVTWKLLKAMEYQGGLKKALCGGEALSPPIAEYLCRISQEAWNMYGPTETTIWSSLFRIDENRPDAVWIGKPIDNTRMYILGDNKELLPVGTIGHLYIGGYGLSRGYLNRPDLTAEKFVVDPFESGKEGRMYFTGDLARFLPDGNIEFVGRSDHQVKVRGYRIELSEIESSLSKVAGVTDSLVVIHKDHQGECCLTAYIQKEASIDLNGLELKKVLQKTMPDYMIPSNFLLLDQFPLTANGKIDRKGLPKPDFNNTQRADFVAPVTELERVLSKLWIDILGIPEVSITESFFDAGGTSLSIVQVYKRMQEQIPDKLPEEFGLNRLFKYPSIKTMADYLSSESKIDFSQEESRANKRRQKMQNRRRS